MSSPLTVDWLLDKLANDDVTLWQLQRTRTTTSRSRYRLRMQYDGMILTSEKSTVLDCLVDISDQHRQLVREEATK